MPKKFFVPSATILLAILLASCGGANIPAQTPRPSSDATAVSTPSSSNTDTNVPTTAGPDADGDGIPDSTESLLGADPNNADTDGDGQNDRVDANPTSAENPITESSTTAGFTINSILVENNVDASNQAVADHLELSLTNTGTTELTNFDIYYTITDLTTNQVQSFYRTLPDFALAAGETKSLHFDNAEQPNHFSVDPNSMYYLDHNQLRVDVILHTAGYAPQTATVNKDPGGEGGVE